MLTQCFAQSLFWKSWASSGKSSRWANVCWLQNLLICHNRRQSVVLWDTLWLRCIIFICDFVGEGGAGGILRKLTFQNINWHLFFHQILIIVCVLGASKTVRYWVLEESSEQNKCPSLILGTFYDERDSQQTNTWAVRPVVYVLWR